MPLRDKIRVEIICNHIQKNNLNVLELNVCANHLHFILVCLNKKLAYIVGKLKSMVAREFNIWRGITIPCASAEGHSPVTRGETQNSLWAQKFNVVKINDGHQLNTVLNYITNNRLKHGLPAFSYIIEQLIKETIIDFDKTFLPDNHFL